MYTFSEILQQAYVVQRLKRLETIQAIEHSVVVNACKKSGKISIHSLWHAVEVLPQPSYVTSLCKLAIAYMQIVGYEFESSDCVPSRDTYRRTSLVETRIEFESQIVVCCLLPYNF